MDIKEKSVDVVIIGAGSAGLTALRNVKKYTENFIIIDKGPLGTTCARVGCMPSKVLIHIANKFHNRLTFKNEGVMGQEQLEVNVSEVLKEVRKKRDKFTKNMINITKELAGDKLIYGRAIVEDEHTVCVENRRFKTGRIIIATGARPIVPDDWKIFADKILTSSSIFEQITLPKRVAVIGTGAVGLELAQALRRLGLEVTCFSHGDKLGGLSDPSVNAELKKAIEKEVPLVLGHEVRIEKKGEELEIYAGDHIVKVDKLLLAMGTKPNLDKMGLEKLGIDIKQIPIYGYNPLTGQVGSMPIFLAGDVNSYRAVLHEALHEGAITGKEELSIKKAVSERKTPLRIVFCDPQVAVVGKSYDELKNTPYIIGKVDFEDESRRVVEDKNSGCAHIYTDPQSGRILGAEMAAPDAEHLAHLLALAIQNKMTDSELLKMPFYHPTMEESIKRAVISSIKQRSKQNKK